MDLRAEIKAWEREFQAEHGRKPGSADIKQHKHVYDLYKRYQRGKKSAGDTSGDPPRGPQWDPQSDPSTPKKTRPADENQAQDSDEPEELDMQPQELFPTPQMGGRILGIFDIRIPATPSKTMTPKRQVVAATPTSRRTPTYLRQRQDGSSPVKPSRRFRSISEFASNAANSDEEMPTMSLSEIAQFSLVEPAASTEPLPEGEQAPQKKFKRKVKKVIRPVLPTDVPVTTKERPNFKRLNIQPKRR